MDDWQGTSNRNLVLKYEGEYYMISERQEQAYWVQNITHMIQKFHLQLATRSARVTHTYNQQGQGSQVSCRGFKING
jgi:hypothetical protein